MNKEDYKIAYENVMIANKMIQEENKQLKEIIDKAIKHLSNEFLCYDNESDEYIQALKTIEILEGKSE